MGNANRREDGANGAAPSAVAVRMPLSDSMANTPPQSPGRSRSALLFAPEVPEDPLQRGDGHSFFNQIWWHDSPRVADSTSEKGIPLIITWNYGGSDVSVEGSWDNWRSRYTPDLPFVANEMGQVCNLLDFHDYVPENLDSVTELKASGSPNSGYGQAFPTGKDFAKEPVGVPFQLHLTVLGMDNEDGVSSSRPQRVVLSHLFTEKGSTSQSVVVLGLTHRLESKYVTVVLYKPLKK